MGIYDEAFVHLKAGNSASIEMGLSMIRAEVDARPSDMKALFEYAGAFDFLGREEEALPHYEKVLAAGISELPEDDRPRLFVQLGSTLRNLKRFDRSREVLLEGLDQFPASQALKAFLALTEYSDGEHAKALQRLFDIVLENRVDDSISEYARPLHWYAERIESYP
jgi:tetratricopeptide (TPR) repeat protein